MPRERLQHGKLYVHTPVPNAQASDTPGEPIKVREYYPGQELTKDQYIREEPSLDVSWNRDAGWVQIAFEAPRDWWERFAVSLAEDTSLTHYGAFTNVMTRSEINNAIKTLRRARDAAYGADE